MPNGIDVVIVSYRCADLLRGCLASLRRYPPENGETLSIRLIDNHSADGTADAAAEFPEVDLVVNDSNRGFAAASNQGIRMGRAPFVLLLNPDVQVRPGTLATLVEALRTNPAAAAAGPRLVRPDGGIDHAGKRSFPTVSGALSYFTRLDRVLPRTRQYTAPEVSEGPVDAINGAFMLIRRDALDEVGVFDEGYWMYMEDLDLCYRFWAASRPVLYEPRAVASHVKGGSAGSQRGPRLNAAFHYGMYRFYRKFYAPSRNLPANLLVYGGIAFKLMLSVLTNSIRSLGSRIAAAATREAV